MIFVFHNILIELLTKNAYSFLTEQQISKNEKIHQWPRHRDNLQILFCNDSNGSEHFVLIYYNKQRIYLYAFCPFILEEKFHNIISDLHPYYFDENNYIEKVTFDSCIFESCSLQAISSLILCLFKINQIVCHIPGQTSWIMLLM